MSYPKRFAGYESPAVLLKDSALTREQKLSALQSWRSQVRKLGLRSESQRRLIAEIERALAALRRS